MYTKINYLTIIFCLNIFPLFAQPTISLPHSRRWKLIWADEFDGKQNTTGRTCPNEHFLVLPQDGYGDVPHPLSPTLSVSPTLQNLDKCTWGIWDFDGTQNGEKINHYSPSMVDVKNGSLHLNCEHNPAGKDKNSYLTSGIQTKPAMKNKTCNCCDAAKTKVDSLIEEFEGFDFEFGRLELRVRLPANVPGAMAAGWTLPCGKDLWWPNAGEIDIFEYWYKPIVQNRYIQCTYHLGAHSNTSSAPAKHVYKGFRYYPNDIRLFNTLADDFHIIAAEWSPKELRFYVDNNLLGVLHEGELFYHEKHRDCFKMDIPPSNSVMSSAYKFYFILSSTMSLSYGLSDGQKEKSLTEFDYVRLYREAGENEYGVESTLSAACAFPCEGIGEFTGYDCFLGQAPKGYFADIRGKELFFVKGKTKILVSSIPEGRKASIRKNAFYLSPICSSTMGLKNCGEPCPDGGVYDPLTGYCKLSEEKSYPSPCESTPDFQKYWKPRIESTPTSFKKTRTCK